MLYNIGWPLYKSAPAIDLAPHVLRAFYSHPVPPLGYITEHWLNFLFYSAKSLAIFICSWLADWEDRQCFWNACEGERREASTVRDVGCRQREFFDCRRERKRHQLCKFLRRLEGDMIWIPRWEVHLVEEQWHFGN